MGNAIKKAFAWISGQAPEGQRKLVFCTRLELMLFALMLLKPTPELGEAIVNSMVIIGITGVSGNGVEWVTKAFSSKQAGNGAA